MKGSDKLRAFAAANPSAPTRAEVHPEQAQAFEELRTLLENLETPKGECWCGLSTTECVRYNPDGCPDAP